MRLEDVSSQLDQANTQQDEAAKTVVAANFFESPTDQFKEFSKDLVPKMEDAFRFDFATPVVADTIRESSQDASAIKPGIENLNYVEKLWNHAAAQWNKRRPDAPMNQLNQLRFKQLMQPDSLTEEETFKLIDLQEQEANDFGTPNYGIEGFWEQVPGLVAGEISNLQGIVERNKSIFAAGVAAGAVRGGVGGLGTGPIGVAAGVGVGALTGLGLSYVAASAYDAFRDTAAQSYGAILNAKDDNGQPIKMDRDTARYLAMGTGVVSAALENVADVAILKKVPGLKKLFGGEAAAEIAKEAVDSPLRKVLSIIGSAGIEGGTETVQEMVQILSEELTGTFDQGNQEFRVQNALNRFVQRVDPTGVDYETQDRLAGSGLIGGILGGGFHVAAETAPKVVQGVKKVAKASGIVASPESQSVPVNQQVIPAMEKALDGAAFEDSLNFSTATLNESPKFKNLPKEYKSKILGKMLNQYVPDGQVWLSAKIREHLGSNPDKMERVQAVLDKNKLTPDAPIQVSNQEFADLVLEYPELSEWAQTHADGMTGQTARDFVEQEKAYQQKKRELKSKFDLGEKSPEERAYKVKANSSMTDVELAKALDSKETATAYLARLDVEESAILEEVKNSGQQINNEQRDSLNNIANLRSRTQAMAPNLPDHMTVQDVTRRAFEQQPQVEEITSLEDYVDRPTFTEALKGILPETEVKTIEEASQAARQQTSNAIMDAAVYEMNQVVDEVTLQATEVQFEIEAEKIKNDPNLKIVDKFYENNPQVNPTARFKNVTEMTAAHVKEGYSPFAIDPRLLTEKQRNKYLKDPQLKKHKVFVKGGMSPDESAAFLGVNGGDNLLNIMSSTKTRKETIEDLVSRHEKSIRDKAIDSVDLDQTSIVKAANNRAKNHLSEAKYLKDERWSAFKKAIKRVAKALPTIEVLQKQADLVASQTKVKDLAPKKYQIGERRAHNRAVDAVVKGDLEQGFDAKEQAALNALLTSETQKAVADVNRAKKFVRKLRDPKNIRLLKDAGMLDAANELLDVFNLDSSKKGSSKRGSYVKFLDRAIQQGMGNFSIPESVTEKLGDPRTKLGDMTVEEVRFAHTRLKQLLKMAEMKNDLMLKYGNPAKEVLSFDETVRGLVEEAQSHPDFDSAAAKNRFTDKVEKYRADVLSVRSFWSSMKNIEHLALQLDRNKLQGKWYQAIVAPLKGDGEYSHWGDAGKTKDWIALRKHFEKNIIEYFGEKEWKAMAVNRFEVPEFKDIQNINFNDNDGTVSEATLFMMLLNDGNDSNSKRLANYGIPIETIRKVYNRHLTEKHGVAAQRIFDIYKSYFPRVNAMHERMTGETVKMIEGRPFTVGGKVFPGGYYPVTYMSTGDVKEVQSKLDLARKAMQNGEKPYMRDFYYADDMTRHGHTENRAEMPPDKFLNLDMSTIGTGFDKVLHDLNFREPVSQVLRLLGDKDVAGSAISVFGDKDFNALFGNVIDAAQSQEAENEVLWNSTEMYNRAVARVKNASAVGYLVANTATIAIQPTNLIFSYDLMGASGFKHTAEILTAIAANPTNFMTFIEKAGEINPTIKAWANNLDDNARNQLSEVLPKNYSGNITKFLGEMNDSVNQKGFAALGLIDALSKSIVTLTAYKQFLSGDSKVATLDQIKNMTPKEIEDAATSYSNQVARLSLTATQRTDRAGIQKDPKFRLATTFWNDARQNLLNAARKTREVKWKIKEGNYVGATNAALTTLMVMGMVKVFQDFARGNDLPFWDEDEKELDVKEAMAYFATAPLDITVGNIPVVRNAYYYVKTKEWNKASTDLGTQALTQIVNAGYTTVDWTSTVIMDHKFKKISKGQAKDIGMALGYITGGVPVTLVTNLINAMNSKAKNDSYVPPLSIELKNNINELQEMKDAGEVEIPQDVWDKVLEMEQEVNPETELEPVPAETSQIIKDATSGGKWYAKSDKSDKAGLYMFSKATWDFIDRQAPELALTPGGRVSSSPSQQEEAMEWYINYNNEALAREGIRGTVPNLYAAHILGAENAVKVLTAKDEKTLKTLVDNKTLEENELKASMKVKDFKLWADNKVASDKAIS